MKQISTLLFSNTTEILLLGALFGVTVFGYFDHYSTNEIFLMYLATIFSLLWALAMKQTKTPILLSVFLTAGFSYLVFLFLYYALQWSDIEIIQLPVIVISFASASIFHVIDLYKNPINEIPYTKIVALRFFMLFGSAMIISLFIRNDSLVTQIATAITIIMALLFEYRQRYLII